MEKSIKVQHGFIWHSQTAVWIPVVASIDTPKLIGNLPDPDPDHLPNCQSGFRSYRSTQDQLLKLIQHATQGFQTGKTTILTCFDNEKAYDKIHHQNFIYNLSSIVGLSDDLVAFLLNYLSNRTVVFKMSNARSQLLTLRAGTPQSDILSPTLFNLWVSGIPLKSGTSASWQTT